MTAEPSRIEGGWKARAVLVVLFATFLLPVVAAFVLNVVAPHWLPFGQVNRGELVEPAVPAGLETLQPLDGGPREPEHPEAVWTLVHVGPAACGPPCEDALVSIRQARLALGKDATRVERWWLLTDPVQPDTLARARAIDSGLRVGMVSPDAALRGGGPIQLVDPSGYLVLRYSDPSQASDVLKDLKRLLKISKQG